MKKILRHLLILAATGISITIAWALIIRTDFRFLPVIRHFALGNDDLAVDRQEILRHLPIGSGIEDVQSVMNRNGFVCRNVQKGEAYDAGYILSGRGRPVGERDFLACYLRRGILPCQISRRAEVDVVDRRMTKLAVYGDYFCFL